jgi:hypothetical protein
MTNPDVLPHSAAWTAQTWISFVVSFAVLLLGIYWLPVDIWIKGFLGMGVLFVVGSSLSLAKTVRDQHEAQKLTKRIDEARVSKLIAEHDPLSPGM